MKFFDRYGRTNNLDEAVDANDFNQMLNHQKVVLASIVFEELLKELSALSQEHYVFEQKQHYYNFK